MSIARMLKQSVQIARTQTAAGVKRQFAVVATGVASFIQPLDPEASRNIGMTFGQAYRGFFLPDANLRVGDRVTKANGDVLSVRGVQLRDYGANPHLEATLEQDKAN